MSLRFNTSIEVNTSSAHSSHVYFDYAVISDIMANAAVLFFSCKDIFMQYCGNRIIRLLPAVDRHCLQNM